MKKMISLLLLTLLLTIASLSGCATIVEENNYPKSKAQELNSSIASKETYTIKYSMKKSRVLYYTSSGTDTEAQRETYEIKGANVNRSGVPNDYKWNYKGTVIEQKSIITEKTTQKFHQYNDKDYMYYLLDGKEVKKRKLIEVAADSVDKLDKAYYSETHISRIKEYVYSDGTKQYVFEYALDKATIEALTRPPAGVSFYPGVNTTITAKKDKDGANILRMFVKMDREGRIIKQEVEIFIYVADELISGQNAKGEIIYNLTIEYAW